MNQKKTDNQEDLITKIMKILKLKNKKILMQIFKEFMRNSTNISKQTKMKTVKKLKMKLKKMEKNMMSTKILIKLIILMIQMLMKNYLLEKNLIANLKICISKISQITKINKSKKNKKKNYSKNKKCIMMKMLKIGLKVNSKVCIIVLLFGILV